MGHPPGHGFRLTSALAVSAATVLVTAIPADAGALLPSGQLWSYDADTPPASVRVYDLSTDATTAIFTPAAGGNGRAVAYDPVDDTIWLAWLNPPGPLDADGFIRKYPRHGGPEITRIPDPHGPGGLGIGALDFDSEDGVLWAAAYYADSAGRSQFLMLDPCDGRVIRTCYLPFIRFPAPEGNDTLTIARLPDLGGRKVLLTDCGEEESTLFAIDTETCDLLATYPLPVSVTGAEFDEPTGQLLAANTTGTIHNLGEPPFAAVVSSVRNAGLTEDLALLAATPPEFACNTGGPYHAECNGRPSTVRLDGSRSHGTGGCALSLVYAWSSDCAGAVFDDPTLPRPSLTLAAPSPCQVDCTVTLSVTDTLAATTVCTSSLVVEDTLAPELTASEEDHFCLWPPDHRYVCFAIDDFQPRATDACSTAIEYRFAGCVSDQPDDAPDPLWRGWSGDGNTHDDCIISNEGRNLCARAERCSAGPGAGAGRRYAVTMTGRDDCGNSSAPVSAGFIHVPHSHSEAAVGCR